jgi:hypothetical protein
MSQGGKHGHTIRRLRRRIEAVLEAERERSRPLPPPLPPINQEHADLRRQIKELHQILVDDPENPQGTDQMKKIEERMEEDPELAIVAARLLVLQREECALLYKNGVDYRAYDVSQVD